MPAFEHRITFPRKCCAESFPMATGAGAPAYRARLHHQVGTQPAGSCSQEHDTQMTNSSPVIHALGFHHLQRHGAEWVKANELAAKMVSPGPLTLQIHGRSTDCTISLPLPCWATMEKS